MTARAPGAGAKDGVVAPCGDHRRPAILGSTSPTEMRTPDMPKFIDVHSGFVHEKAGHPAEASYEVPVEG